MIGDGPRDQRILKEVAKKYDHRKTLLHPQLPFTHYLPQPGRTGLSPALETAYYLAARYDVDRVLVVIDREHLPGDPRRPTNELRRHGIHPVAVTTHQSGLIEVQANIHLLDYGQKRVHILIAPQGFRRSIDEGLAVLIHLIYRDQVGYTKEDVNRWLKQRDIEDYELVELATREQVEKAFPALVHALKLLAGEG